MSNGHEDDKIAEFVQLFVATMGASPAPGVPDGMKVGAPSKSGWSEWIAIPSPITQSDLLSIEHSIGSPLPPLFARYLTYKCVLMTNFGILSLPEIRCDQPLKGLNSFFGLMETQPYWRSNGYVPFGDDGDDYGILAFDMKRPTSDGDYPVMYVAPDKMKQQGYRGIQKWNSFSELLDSVKSSLLSYKK
jgi:hypothetical protein